MAKQKDGQINKSNRLVDTLKKEAAENLNKGDKDKSIVIKITSREYDFFGQLAEEVKLTKQELGYRALQEAGLLSEDND